MGFLKALVAVPLALVVILLAIANKGPVMLSLDPFATGTPEIGVTLPLFAVVLGSVAIGVLLGGIGSWVAGGKGRRARRRSVREVSRLEAETQRLRAAVAAAGPGLPALPDRRVFP